MIRLLLNGVKLIGILIAIFIISLFTHHTDDTIYLSYPTKFERLKFGKVETYLVVHEFPRKNNVFFQVSLEPNHHVQMDDNCFVTFHDLSLTDENDNKVISILDQDSGFSGGSSNKFNEIRGGNIVGVFITVRGTVKTPSNYVTHFDFELSKACGVAPTRYIVKEKMKMKRKKNNWFESFFYST